MKYWNKQKEVRERCWYRLAFPFTMYRSGSFMEIKRWCQQQPGAKFWCDYKSGFWYFERQQDASWFILKWK